MTKERVFFFTKENKEIEEIKSMSFKKAVKSFQNKVKQPLVYIEWITKKGIEMTKWQRLPIGRKKRLSK